MPSLDTLLDEAAAFLRDNTTCTLVCHADADGLCATAILADALERIGTEVSFQFFTQVSTYAIAQVGQNATGALVFLDMGASHLDAIGAHCTDVPTLVIDHHQPGGKAPHALHCNPVLAGLDGTRVVSAAGLALEIAQRLAPESAAAMGPVALIGAQADNQEPGGFAGINRSILDTAVQAGLVRIREGAKLHGLQTKNILDLVAYSYDLRIPGVTRDREGARALLRELGIRDVERQRYRDLSQSEREELERELLARSTNPDARVNHYTLTRMPNGPLRDTREAATLLNACGRLGEPELAVRMLRGDTNAARDAREVQREYRNAVRAAHQWASESLAQEGPDVRRVEGAVLLNAGAHVPADLTGTLCSVLTKGEEVPKGTIVVCIARNIDGTETSKASARAQESPVDLAALMRAAAAAVGGEGGGHAVAAGALFLTEAEEAFLDAVEDALKSL